MAESQKLNRRLDHSELARVLGKVLVHWDLGYRVPIPRMPRCPYCDGTGLLSPALGEVGDLLIRTANFHPRDRNSRTVYRCDVSLKCTACSFVPMFGVVVHRDMFDEGRSWGAQLLHHAIEEKLQEGVVYEQWG